MESTTCYTGNPLNLYAVQPQLMSTNAPTPSKTILNYSQIHSVDYQLKWIKYHHAHHRSVSGWNLNTFSIFIVFFRVFIDFGMHSSRLTIFIEKFKMYYNFYVIIFNRLLIAGCQCVSANWNASLEENEIERCIILYLK